MSVSSLLGKLFNIRPGEWRRLSLLYTMSLVALTGLNWGDAIVQAAFLQRVGVQQLPWVFVSSAACSLIALFIYSAFADRVSNTRLLVGLLAISIAGLLLGLVIIGIGQVVAGFLVVYLVMNVPLMDVYNVHWATYVNGFYDIRAAKRIVPVMGTSARLAGIVAGLSMPLLNRVFIPFGIMLVAIGSLVVMAMLAVAMPRLLGEHGDAMTRRREDARRRGRDDAKRRGREDAGTRPDENGRPNQVGLRARVRSQIKGMGGGYGTSLREGYLQISRSPFLRWMALSTLSMTVLLAFMNYQASAIFQAELKTTVQISNFVGLVSGVANLVILPIQLFLLSRLIARAGLDNTSLIYPVASLVAAGGLIVAPGLPTAALAYLDRTALRTAFRSPIENLLYNAVPLRVKARSRAFVSGLLVPVGNIVGGVLLLIPLGHASWFLPAAIVVVSLALLAAGLLVRRHYARALVDLLEQEDYSSLTLQAPSLQAPEALPAADAATLARLAQKLRQSPSPERAVFMARLLLEIGGDKAASAVVQAARDATDGRLRASLVDVLVAADVRGQDVHEFYAALLADRDGQVRLAAIGGLEQIDGPDDRRYLEIATRLLADPEIAVRLRVLPALLRSDDPEYRIRGADELRALLKAPDPRARARTLQMVGQTHLAEFLPEVAAAITDSLGEEADEVRLAGALAAEMLARDGLRAGDGLAAADRELLLSPALKLVHDPMERARLAAVTILGLLVRGAGRPVPGMRLGLAESAPDSGRPGREGGQGGGQPRGQLRVLAALEGLVVGLGDASPEVREATVEGLARAGERAIPRVQTQLDSADPQVRKMAVVALARIDPRKYAPVVRGPVLNENLAAIYRNLGHLQPLAGCPGPAVSVLGRALRERNAALLDESFYLLSMIHDAGAVHTVARSLRSPQPLTRANAAEALETMTAPQTAALITPLFEPELPPGQLRSLLRQTGNPPLPADAEAALRLLLSNEDAWLRTLAAAAMEEWRSGGAPTGERRSPCGGVEGQRSGGAEERRSGGVEELRLVQKLILLREVPFFQGMTIEQLKVLATACEEQWFAEGMHIYFDEEPGGAFYLVVDGQVGIEQCTRTGSVRVATVGTRSCFGESELFDGSPRPTAAVALQNTLTLSLRREPLVELARRYPDISLQLIDVLAQRLREASDQIADLAPGRTRKLQRMFDSFEGAR